VLVYTIISMFALVGITSLAVDLGRLQEAKTELERSADAAARAAAYDVLTSTSQALADAQTYASYNTVDGTPLTLLSSDIVFGKWSPATQTLVTSSAAPDSVQVTAVRSYARGTSIPLIIGQIIGLDHCDLTFTVIANSRPVAPNGIIGLSSFDAMNNLLIASYNSSITTTPTSGSSNSNAILGTNGSITDGTGNLNGSVILGPFGTQSGLTISGSSTHLSSAINTPAAPSWSPGTNPASTPQVYSVGGSTTLPAGTYWFTSLTVSGTLTFSGPTIIYINGNADISGTLTAANGIPANLVIYQIGSYTFGDASSNFVNITAQVIAPGSDFVAKNNMNFYGEMLFNTITVKNNANFFYDEQFGIGPGVTGNAITLVK